MKILFLAWRQLRRDLAAGEIRILFAALVLAVMAVSAVGFLTDRAERGLKLEANRLLGGDAVLRSDQPLADSLRALAAAPGLQHSETRGFPSMVRVGGNLRLGEIRAIADGYPLRGRYRVQVQADGEQSNAAAIPLPGTVWMSRSGADALQARIGDPVSIGNSTLTLAALVTQEPDAALNYFSAGPKVILNLADLPATGLQQEGSRITWRLVVAGEPAAVERFVAAVRPLLGRGQRLETAADARPEIRSALDRAGRFLGLAALVSVVLAAVAVAMAARRHSARHLAGSAVMRCLGASQRTLLGIHAGELLILGALSSAAGVALALGLQTIIGNWLGAALGVAIPPAGLRPAVEGFAVGMIVLLTFAMPPVLALRRVPALRVLRRDIGVGEPSAWLLAVLGLSGLGVLLWWKAGSATLGTAMLLGIGATLGVLGALAWLLIALLRRLRGRLRGPLRYGLANVSRRAASSVAQIASLGLGLMVLLLLTFVRTDLLSRWQQSLPADIANRFIINVQPEQVEPVLDYLRTAGVGHPALYPMIRGRLLEVNGRAISDKDYAEQGERAQRLAEREFNLSFATQLRPDNVVTAGTLWPPSGTAQPELSVERDLAAALGWKLGDSIVFDIAGQRYQAQITSLRKVDWGSFQPNFFVLGSPGSLDGFSASYIGAVRAPAGNSGFTSALVQRFPNLSVIDIDAVLDQVRATISQVTAVVEAVFYFSLAAGILVLLASISAAQDERLLEAALMRVLGGSRRQLLLAQASEFAAIGLLSGLVAATAATVLSRIVARQVFDLPWSANPWLILGSAGVGVAAAMLAGLLATRRVLDAPPTVSLRELQE